MGELRSLRSLKWAEPAGLSFMMAADKDEVVDGYPSNKRDWEIFAVQLDKHMVDHGETSETQDMADRCRKALSARVVDGRLVMSVTYG